MKNARKATNEYEVRGAVWLYPGPAAWHFITVPQKLSRTIFDTFGAVHRGWRSLPLDVTVGKTRWKTSMFWDTKEKGYILPLKAEVRKKEGIKDGDRISLRIVIRP